MKPRAFFYRVFREGAPWREEFWLAEGQVLSAGGGHHLDTGFHAELGAMAGSILAFFIGRYLGRDFAASLIGHRLKRYDDAIERNGFATVLYLRLLYFPFTPMNFGMGLTKVRFWDYFLGTALGIIVGTFIFTFFVGTIREVWASGRREDLLSWKVFCSVALFVFSFFIPKIIQRMRDARTATAD